MWAYAHNGSEGVDADAKTTMLPSHRGAAALFHVQAGGDSRHRRSRQVTLGLDEMEAIRLADLLGLYQEDAAGEMNVSRQTFGRIIDAAHKKVAEALTQGKVLCIKGGTIEMARKRVFRCRACKARWELPCGTGRPRKCPEVQTG